MAFERCEISNQERTHGNNLSISRHGQLTITSVFVKHFVGYENSEIYFDKPNNKIGIKPVKEQSHVTRKLGYWGANRKTRFVSLVTFLKFYSIPFKKRTIYPTHWGESEKMLIIDLNGE